MAVSDPTDAFEIPGDGAFVAVIPERVDNVLSLTRPPMRTTYVSSSALSSR